MYDTANDGAVYPNLAGLYGGGWGALKNHREQAAASAFDLRGTGVDFACTLLQVQSGILRSLFHIQIQSIAAPR